jgi:sugar phosphate isomerase/epimerase
VAGFDGLSIRPPDVRAWLSAAPGRTPAALRRRLADAGLILTELDPIMSWYTPPADRESAQLEADAAESVALLDLAAELGATALSTLVRPGADWDPRLGAESVRALADQAAQRGLLVQLEPFSWSPLRTLDAAWELVTAAGSPLNLGLLVDTWHLDRSGAGPSILDRIDVDRVYGVQVSDGPVERTGPDLAADNRTGRRWPGEGDLHPERPLGQLTRRGWTGPVGVEVFGPAPSDPLAHAREAKASLDRLLALTT